jgi:hypothetical protein
MQTILANSGRSVIAQAIRARTAHMAWGTGDNSWGNTPPAPPNSASALLAEVARRRATLVDYCVADANGSIVVPEGRFSISATPTPNLYFKFHFEFSEGVGATIREQAIFVDTVAANGVPSGQYYLLPAEVANPGTMLVHQRSTPIIRQATTRQLFEFVVTF